MKDKRKDIDMREYGYLFAILFLLMGITTFFLWLVNPKAFFSIGICLFLCYILVFAILFLLLVRREMERQRSFDHFLAEWKQGNDEALPQLSRNEMERFLVLRELLLEQEGLRKTEQVRREDYEEYTENWVHEMKVPLSLLQLLLENRQKEMTPFLAERFSYVHRRMEEQIMQLLYYARLMSAHKDVVFKRISLPLLIQEALLEKQPFLKEKGIKIRLDTKEEEVLSDERGLLFLLSQALYNSCKYVDEAKEEHWIRIAVEREEKIRLIIEDNGIGVKQSELPFLFDKGFTGEGDESRRKATGMGLYLSQKMAEVLHVTLNVTSVYGAGFTFAIEFPVVEIINS